MTRHVLDLAAQMQEESLGQGEERKGRQEIEGSNEESKGEAEDRHEEADKYDHSSQDSAHVHHHARPPWPGLYSPFGPTPYPVRSHASALNDALDPPRPGWRHSLLHLPPLYRRYGHPPSLSSTCPQPEPPTRRLCLGRPPSIL